MRIVRRLAISLALAILLVPYSVSAQVNSTWFGGSGEWDAASLWNPNVVPDGAFNVFIDNGWGGNSVVTIDNGDAFTVDSLTIDVGDVLQFDNGSRLTIQTDIGRPDSGKITNDGEIFVTNSGTFTRLYIENNTILAGLGTITLGGTNDNSQITDPSLSDGVLTNVDNVIQGKGKLGDDTLQFVNMANGLIVANDPTGILTLRPRDAGTMSNMGIMRASGGGHLIVMDSNFDNTGGIIEALAGSKVTFQGGASIAGGTLQTSGDGILEISNGGNSDFADLTIDGTFIVNNAADAYLHGSITNLGTSIDVNNTGSFTYLMVDSAATLDGGGTITLQGTSNNSGISDPSLADGVLTNVDNVIQGKGKLGDDTLQITNMANGLIDANDPTGILTLRPRDADTTFNMGIMRASGGGQLIVTDADFDNAGGIIEALAGSTVTFEGGASITGGTLQTSGDGILEVSNAGNSDFTDLTIDGTFVVNNAADAYLHGSITNLGTSIDVNNTGSFTYLMVDTAATLDGGGTITLQGTNDNSGISDPSLADGDLTNVDNVIQGKGKLGDDTLQITNMANGLIDANDPTGTLTLRPRDADTTFNMGNMRASDGGQLIITDGEIDNSGGIIEARANSMVALNSNASITGGTLQTSGNGVIVVNSGNSHLTDLTIDGTVNQNNATTLTINGTINNNDSINVNSTGSFTTLNVVTPVVVSGPGTISLPHANSRINGAGTIEIDGGILTGIGHVNPDAVANGATIAPGNSVGSLRFFGATTLVNASKLDLELGAISGTPGLDWDLISVSGTLDFEDAILDSGVVVAPTSLDLQGLPGLLDGFDSNQNYSWKIADANALSGFDKTYFKIDASGIANPHDGLFGVESNGEDVFFTYDPTAVQTNADSLNVVLGSVIGGSLDDTFTSDDSSLRIFRGNPVSPIFPAIWLEFSGVLPTDTPEALAFKIESNADTNDILQRLELYNYQSGVYENIDERESTLHVDSIVEIVVDGDPTRFVQPGTGAVKARVTYTEGPSTFALAWNVDIDHLAWVIP